MSKPKKRKPVSESKAAVSKQQARGPGLKQFFSVEFIRFLGKRENLIEAGLISLISIGIYFLFRYFYPVAATWSDSVDYVRCAGNGHLGGYRPYGYSGFLSFLHEMKQGIEFVLITQFLLLWLSNLYLIFTIKFFFGKGPRWLFYLFVLFIIGNEGLIYLTRWLMSDTGYGAFLVFWFTSFLWLLKNPLNIFNLCIHIFALYFTIDFRYSGLILPLISSGVFIYYYRIRGVPLLLGSIIVLYSIYTESVKQHKKYFGVEMFSAFSGWSLANNAVAVIPFADIDSMEFKDAQLRQVHSFVRMTPDSVFKTKDYLLNAGFMWHPQYSGKNYLALYRFEHDNMMYIMAWVRCGPIFGRYGKQLILNHPWSFFRHFVLLNAVQVFNPYVKLGPYNEFDVIDLVKQYYDLGYSKFYCTNDVYGKYLESFSLVKNVVLWILALTSVLVWVWRRKEIAQMNDLKRIFIFLAVFLFVYVGFSAVAHPIVYRYVLQFHPFLVTIIFITSAFLINRRHKTDAV